MTTLNTLRQINISLNRTLKKVCFTFPSSDQSINLLIFLQRLTSQASKTSLHQLEGRCWCEKYSNLKSDFFIKKKWQLPYLYIFHICVYPDCYGIVHIFLPKIALYQRLLKTMVYVYICSMSLRKYCKRKKNHSKPSLIYQFWRHIHNNNEYQIKCGMLTRVKPTMTNPQLCKLHNIICKRYLSLDHHQRPTTLSFQVLIISHQLASLRATMKRGFYAHLT